MSVYVSVCYVSYISHVLQNCSNVYTYTHMYLLTIMFIMYGQCKHVIIKAHKHIPVMSAHVLTSVQGECQHMYTNNVFKLQALLIHYYNTNILQLMSVCRIYVKITLCIQHNASVYQVKIGSIEKSGHVSDMLTCTTHHTQRTYYLYLHIHYAYSMYNT